MKPRAREYAAVAVAASILSLGFFFLHWTRGDVLLYGDALAHINIARRIFDSLTPGLGQLGTPWLPLPHLLMLPFLAVDGLWQSGIGGSIPSMLAYVFAVVGVYRLVRELGVAAAALASGILALNPNLLYLQTTAMTEPLAMVLFLWATVFLSDFLRQPPAGRERTLVLCGLCLTALVLTRYDGWFYTAAFGTTVLLLAPRQVNSHRRAFALMLLLPVLAAGAWMAYNRMYFGDHLEFARGEHSAKGIAERTTPPGSPGHPGQRDPWVAAVYYQKVAKLNLGESPWQHVLMLLAVGGALLTLVRRGRQAVPWLLLWLPLPVYTLSVAYGYVPIFFPEWHPNSYYNVRYGVHLVPAVAVFTGTLASTVAGAPGRWRVAYAIVLAVVALNYASAWRAVPITLREARVNTMEKNALEERLAAVLSGFDRDATFLMYGGTHPGAVQRAGIPWRQIITESNYGFWQQAIAAPAEHADYVVAVEGDPLWELVQRQPQGLELVARVEAGSRRALIFRTACSRGTIQPLPAEHEHEDSARDTWAAHGYGGIPLRIHVAAGAGRFPGRHHRPGT